MPFQTRNPFYLRISEKNVLPLYLYLDERHLGWMSDLVFQRVLADLRPHILPKLKADANLLYATGSSSKKPTVDTYRGETYQFCYFLRKTEPHSVVIKTRKFVAVPTQKRPEMLPPPVPSSSKPQRGKRKVKPGVAGSAYEGVRKKRKTKGKGRALVEEEEPSSSGEDLDDDATTQQPRRSKRATNTPVGGYQDIEDGDTQAPPSNIVDPAPSVHEAPDVMEIDNVGASEIQYRSPSSMAVDLEQEEEKPKPILQLKYQGFDIYGHCLCIVVEPWPPIRSISRAPSIFVQPVNRAPSIAPPDFAPARDPSLRARTPLFLPDDDRDRSETPMPFQGQRTYPPVSSLLDPNFLEDSDDEEGGMMAFSQVLNAAGDFRAGAADDDEDMDNAIFFGDADEVREL